MRRMSLVLAVAALLIALAGRPAPMSAQTTGPLLLARAEGTIWLLEPSTGDASSAVIASAGWCHCAA